jgi:hypothetical protein
LQRKSQSPNQTTDVSRMVAHLELLSDHLRHPLARPRFSSKAVRLGSSRQKLAQSGALLLRRGVAPPGGLCLRPSTPSSRHTCSCILLLAGVNPKPVPPDVVEF